MRGTTISTLKPQWVTVQEHPKYEVRYDSREDYVVIRYTDGMGFPTEILLSPKSFDDMVATVYAQERKKA